MRKSLKSLLAAVLISFSCLFAASCTGSSSLESISMSNEDEIEVPFGKFSYDGIMVTLHYESGAEGEIELEESMIPEAERLKFFKIGKQEVKVVYHTYYSTTMKINVVLNEFSDDYELVGYKCVYDGKPHDVKLNHELPEGATVTFPKGYSFTNIGTYAVTAVIEKSGYATKTLEATLEILPKSHDESAIVFEDKTVPYNGEPQTIEALNVPEGVNVLYTYWDSTQKIILNKVANAGTYYVHAEFVNDNPNYKKIESKTAKLTIEKVDYDLSGVSFPSVVKTHDGIPYKPELINPEALPHGLTANCVVEDEYGHEIVDCSNVGKYVLKAYIEGGDTNHYEIKPLEASLTIAPEIIEIRDIAELDGLNVTFTGEAFYVDDSHILPSSFDDLVDISLDQPSEGFTYVGEYPVVATFTAKDSNQKTDLESLPVYVLIQPANAIARVYDGVIRDPVDPYHDISLEDIKFDITGNTYQITGPLALSGDFPSNYTVSPTVLSLYKVTTDSTTEEVTRTPVQINQLTVENTYEFSLEFEVNNGVEAEKEALNESLLVNMLVGTFKYDTVKTLNTDGEYTKEFDASNIHICTSGENSAEKARIVNVESGVTAKSINFYTTNTYETSIDPSNFVFGNTYYYKVEFNQQESAVYVDAAGSFTYKDAPFTVKELSIQDGEASTIYDSSYVGTQLDIETISVSDTSTSQTVSLDALEDGHSYNYNIVFVNKADTIWGEETGSFSYERVKDLTTHDPITADNISICGNTASIVNISEDIEVKSVKFYLGDGEVQPSSLQANNVYRYSIVFENDNSTNKVYAQETGDIYIGGRVQVKGSSGNYDTPFSLANIKIGQTSATDPTLTASIVDLDPQNIVRSINFYDNEGNSIGVNSLVTGQTYTYEVLFKNTDGLNWIGERGSFLYQKVQDTSGSEPKDIDATNIVLMGNSASVIGIASDIEVDSIKFYSGHTEVSVNNFVVGTTYQYIIAFKNGTSTVYAQAKGSIVYGGSVTVEGATPGTYDAPFSFENLLISYKGVADYTLEESIVGLNPVNTVRSINIYNVNGDITSLTDLEYDQTYTYVVLFNNDNERNWLAETGTFTYKRVVNSNGVLDFNAQTNLKIKDGVATLVNITEGAEAKSIKVFDYDTKAEITNLNTLENGKTYYYKIMFKNTDSNIWAEEMGTFVHPTTPSQATE